MIDYQTRLRAMVDMAIDDPHALECVHDLVTAEAIIRRLIGRLDLAALIELISNSPHPAELLVKLPLILGKTPEVMEAVTVVLLKSRGEWDNTTLFAFADEYWCFIVRELIARGDYRRAWDETRRAWNGFGKHDYVDGALPHHGYGNLAASRETVVSLIGQIYERLVEMKVLSPASEEPVEAPERSQYGHGRIAKVAGIAFADAVGGIDAKNMERPHAPRYLNPLGKQVVSVAGYYAAERSAARKRRASQTKDAA